MMELIATNMAPIMFASLVVFLLLGYPVAFSLASIASSLRRCASRVAVTSRQTPR